MRFLSILLLLGAIVSCSKLQPNEIQSYYDVDSLVNAQYEALKLTDYRLFKTSTVNGLQDTSYITPDSAQWNYELGVFRKANINKPLLRGEYSVEVTNENDEKIVTYSPKKPADRTVKLLEVKYSGKNLAELHASVQEENPIYGSTRSLSMYFQGEGKNNRLVSYEVTGAQKMILKDTVTLHVNTEILYDLK